jgi:hypothetical protein
MKSKARPKYLPPKNFNAEMTEFEEYYDQKIDINERPPCRQNNNIFDLEDCNSSVLSIQKFNVGRNTRGEKRPPSRHKTPPKAVGLELPPKRIPNQLIPAENIFQQENSLSDLEKDSLSNTMPINLNESEITKKNKTFFKDFPAEEVDKKIKMKPSSAKKKSSDVIVSRMWSGTSKKKQSLVDTPPVFVKERKNQSFSSSRGEKPKSEKDTKDLIFEDKRKTYFKKNSERAQSSNNKSKVPQLQSSLEPEFLNLFAKPEEFYF